MQLIKSYLKLKDKSHLLCLQLENKMHIYLSETKTSAFTAILLFSVSPHLTSVINNHFLDMVGSNADV